MKRMYLPVPLLGLVALLAGCKGKPPANQIETGGSTFVYPMMSKWAVEYEQARGVHVRYAYTGSGDGIRNMLDGKYEFGCTDGPLSEEELSKARDLGNEIAHIPLVHGAVVLAYNVPGLSQPLIFSGPVLADVYLGRITRWNDRQLQELNPGVALPNEPIRVVRRRDSSGTTFVFVDYLCKVAPPFKDKMGGKPGKTIAFAEVPGVTEPGNSGVAGYIKRTPYSLGYVELNQCVEDGLPFGDIQVEKDVIVRASPASIRAAAQTALAVKVPDDLRFSICNAGGSAAYPISGTVWAVLRTRQPREQGTKVKDFLHWLTHEGQQFVDAMNYARLADVLKEPIDKKLAQITTE